MKTATSLVTDVETGNDFRRSMPDLERLSHHPTQANHDASKIGGDTLRDQSCAGASVFDRNVRTYRSSSFQDSPFLDIAALLLSAGTMLAVFGLLRRYDGKRQPNWEHVSLNTAVAWLSAISKACTILLASRSLGQLKWLWLVDKSKPLSDLRTFDMASRGFLGSTVLLFKQRAR